MCIWNCIDMLQFIFHVFCILNLSFIVNYHICVRLRLDCGMGFVYICGLTYIYICWLTYDIHLDIHVGLVGKIARLVYIKCANH